MTSPGFSVALDTGRVACLDSIDAFLEAVEGMGEYDLFDASRCHGWTRLEVVTHVIGGWQEMLAGLVSVGESAPTVDAASYWTAFAQGYADEDPVLVLTAQRRRASAYGRPASAVAHLNDVGESLRRGVVAMDDRPRIWQGNVFSAGDYLCVWAVEDVIHHLDLRSDVPAPASALALARVTIEALVGESLSASWSDGRATLVGAGREGVPSDAAHLAGRLPVLS